MACTAGNHLQKWRIFNHVKALCRTYSYRIDTCKVIANPPKTDHLGWNGKTVIIKSITVSVTFNRILEIQFSRELKNVLMLSSNLI